MTMRRGISGYLTVYNDFDILPHTLRAIAPYVDELVVVDGAYEWMVPYLKIAGTDPARSADAVYDVLEASGIKYRLVSKIWRDEPEKRIAGYGACNGRYVFRIDADEVPFFDDPKLEQFIASGNVIAELFKPTYISPQWLVALNESGLLPAEPFLFDGTRVEPQIHLNYLWLVLGPDRLADAGARPFRVHETPIGFNAHLNEWRDHRSQTRRGTFYWLQSIRETGVPWIPELRDKPLADLSSLFRVTAPEVFSELVASSIILLSQTFRALGWYSVRSPLTRQQEAMFVDRFAAMRSERAALNQMIVSDGLTFWPGMPITLDLSSRECSDILVADGAIRLSSNCALSKVSATLHLLLPGSPWHSCADLECEQQGSTAVVRLPDEPPLYSYLRREVDISLMAGPGEPLRRFQVRR